MVNATASCLAANEQSRAEHPDWLKRGYITKTIMCDVQPFCATETLFSHEFYWPKGQPGRSKRSASSQAVPSRCRSWKMDADWPVTEPHLSRTTTVPRPRSFWDIMKLLPNRTVWLHGDSIMLQMCDAALCSLMRAGVAGTPAVLPSTKKPLWVRNLEAATTYNFIVAPTLPNGARLMCSGIGIFQRAPIEKVLPHVDVAMLNFGLHYNTAAKFEAMLRDALLSLSAWRMGSPSTRVALWREGSAQHFRGTGSYTAGAEKRQQVQEERGAPCECSPLGRDVPDGDNLNVLGWQHEKQLAPTHGVGLVPFFNLTAPRHDMHRRHYCAFDRQLTPGRCCDCTHFCFTPLFWDAVFGGVHRIVRRGLFIRTSLPSAARPARWRANAKKPSTARLLRKKVPTVNGADGAAAPAAKRPPAKRPPAKRSWLVQLASGKQV